MKQGWCVACVDMKKICANHIIATTYLLFTHAAVWNPQLSWTDVNCNVYFSYIGNQVWYVLTGANFMHVTCLLWVWLSLQSVTTTQALGVQDSMPHRNTTSVCVERFVTVERIARHYTLFLCQRVVLNQAMVAHLVGRFAYFEWSRVGFMVRDSLRWLQGTYSNFWQHLLIHGTSTDVR